MLTSRYLGGIPEDSRAGRGVSPFLSNARITQTQLDVILKLNSIAVTRGQTLAQMALSWVLREGKVASVLIGASKVSQLEDNVQCQNNTGFSKDELRAIDEAVKGI